MKNAITKVAIGALLTLQMTGLGAWAAQTSSMPDVDQIIQTQMQVTKEATLKFVRDFEQTNNALSVADFRAKAPTILSALDKALVVFYAGLRQNVYGPIQPAIEQQYSAIYNSTLTESQKKAEYELIAEPIHDQFIQSYQTEVTKLISAIKGGSYKASALLQCESSSCIKLSLNLMENILLQVKDNLAADVSPLAISMIQVRNQVQNEIDELHGVTFMKGFLTSLPFDVKTTTNSDNVIRIAHKLLIDQLTHHLVRGKIELANADIIELKQLHSGREFYLTAEDVAYLRDYRDGEFLINIWKQDGLDPANPAVIHVISDTIDGRDNTDNLKQLCENKLFDCTTYINTENFLGGPIKSVQTIMKWTCGSDPKVHTFAVGIEGHNPRIYPTAVGQPLTVHCPAVRFQDVEPSSIQIKNTPQTIHVITYFYNSLFAISETPYYMCSDTEGTCTFNIYIEKYHTFFDPQQFSIEWTCGDNPTVHREEFWRYDNAKFDIATEVTISCK